MPRGGSFLDLDRVSPETVEVLTRIIIQNYRGFESLDLDLEPGINVLVGPNESGKSTIIEALNLALTGRIGGRWLTQDFSPFLFNLPVTSRFVDSLATESPKAPPELMIEVYFDESEETAHLKGKNNLRDEDACGIRLQGSLSEEFEQEYQRFISEPEKVRLVPTEYYEVLWRSFKGEPINRRHVPAVASVIDPSTIRLQYGTDYHLQRLIENHLDESERVELARQYRSLREEFEQKESIQGINKKIAGEEEPVTDRELTLGLNLSPRFAWESSLQTHLDRLPFDMVGKGEQSALKTLLAIGRKADAAHVILVEEPENHLSFTKLNALVGRIRERCEGKQLIIATHSSFVLNRMGIDQLILLGEAKPTRLSGLPQDTVRFFQRLPGHNTLRFVLAERVVLVEGPSDELAFERAYFSRHNKRPLEVGLDVISVGGLTFRRYLDLAVALEKPVVVLTDNDGDLAAVGEKYEEYDEIDFVTISYEQDESLPSLEQCLLAANGRETLNLALGKSYTEDDRLLKYMKSNKTECALLLYESDVDVAPPEYFEAALAQ